MAEKSIDATQGGENVSLAVGQKLTIRLPAQMGTGFSWQELPNSLLRLDEKKVERSTQIPGGQEEQVFRFTVGGRGINKLVLQYKRPWEIEKAPAKEFKVDITIDR